MEVKNFSLVVYDTLLLFDGLSYLIRNKNLVSYAYIYHDKDIDENGDLKKAHYHLYINFSTRTSDKMLRKLFNTEIVQNCKNVNNYIAYFLHVFDRDKYQYDKSNIVSYNINIDECLNSVFSKCNDDNAILMELVDYIYIKKLNNYEILKYVIENNILSIYQKYYYIIRDIKK